MNLFGNATNIFSTYKQNFTGFKTRPIEINNNTSFLIFPQDAQCVLHQTHHPLKNNLKTADEILIFHTDSSNPLKRPILQLVVLKQRFALFSKTP